MALRLTDHWGRIAMRFVLIGVVVLLLAAAGYVLAWPTRIEPVAVTVTPSAGFVGPFAPNEALRSVRWLSDTIGQGPEDVTVKDGYAYTGLADGRVVRIRIDGQTPTGPAPVPAPGTTTPPASGAALEKLAETGGRPLGLQHDPFGNIVVADGKRGLLAITPQGQVVVVADRFENRPLRFVDDLDIAKDGTIYFSDASMRYGYDEFGLDFYEGQATGRLFSFDPRSGTLQSRLSGLAFANGVALGPDEEYVLVNETAGNRITRYWLKGAKAGTSDRFIEGLPGYPDNLSFNGRDLFWVALAGPRIKTLEQQLPSTFMRKVMFRLNAIGLAALPTTPDPYGCVIAINLDGQVVMTLQDPGGRTINSITSVNEKDGLLYLGSLSADRIATIPVPPQLLPR
ncbi:MAG: SMP-30/gluconolactonase/LRE family protein [Alphaproteobacteria bacterium]|nr:SMP-30/gluconolactonase/LRE family protein [Alphaproteobacteria bacterium]